MKLEKHQSANAIGPPLWDNHEMVSYEYAIKMYIVILHKDLLGETVLDRDRYICFSLEMNKIDPEWSH